MWRSIEVPALQKVPCFVRKIPWCPDVVDVSCNAVLDGETRQPATDWQRLRHFVGV
jgi:hypothetical protein